MKTCRICREPKTTTEFYTRAGNKGGLRTECKSCHSAAGAQHYMLNQTAYAKRGLAKHLSKSYNLTLDGWYKIFNKQNGVCVICKQPETVIDPRTKRYKQLSVDHDHVTGVVRGLLCVRCNRTLGFLNEDLTILVAMCRYLKKHSSKEP